MLQKKVYKIMSAVEKRDGGSFWIRVGSGYTNRDGSVNIYLDVFPKTFQLQMRELDEEDLRKREPRADGAPPPAQSSAAMALPF